MITQETKELDALVKKYTVDMNAIGEIVVDKLEEAYDKSLNANGSKMKPLKPATVKQKRKLGVTNPAKPLIRTGQTQHSNFYVFTARNKVEISVRDNVRNGTTTNKILDYQEDLGRTPFGRSKIIDEAVDKYLDKQLGR